MHSVEAINAVSIICAQNVVAMKNGTELKYKVV